MKNRYRMYIRDKSKGGKIWWCENTKTGKRESDLLDGIGSHRANNSRQNRPITDARDFVSLMTAKEESNFLKWVQLVPFFFFALAAANRLPALPKSYRDYIKKNRKCDYESKKLIKTP